jgi:hypothetical protein
MMTLKKLLSPRGADYPITISEVFVQKGEPIAKGARLFELKTATGKRMMMRAPLAGRVELLAGGAGDILETQRPLAGIEEAVDEVYAEVEETDEDESQTGAFAMSETIRSMAPDDAGAQVVEPEEVFARKPEPEPVFAPATKPAPEEESQSLVGNLKDIVVFSTVIGLPVFFTYIALHIAHSARFDEMAAILIVIGGLVAARIAIWVLQLVSREEGLWGIGWISAYPVALPFAFLSAFAPLSVLQKYDAEWAHKLVTPLTGGPLHLRDGQLVVMGREVRDDRAKNIDEAFRLGVMGAVIDERLIYTEDGRWIRPEQVAFRRVIYSEEQYYANYRLTCMNTDLTRDDGDAEGTYADTADFYFSLRQPHGDVHGTQASFDSTGEAVKIRNIEKKLGRGLISCVTDSYEQRFGLTRS